MLCGTDAPFGRRAHCCDRFTFVERDPGPLSTAPDVEVLFLVSRDALGWPLGTRSNLCRTPPSILACGLPSPEHTARSSAAFPPRVYRVCQWGPGRPGMRATERISCSPKVGAGQTPRGIRLARRPCGAALHRPSSPSCACHARSPRAPEAAPSPRAWTRRRARREPCPAAAAPRGGPLPG